MLAVQTNSIRERLVDVEERMRSQLNGHPSELVFALKELITVGGKRIRPRITLLFGEMMQADPDRILNLAAAIEMLHTATLVHDDLVDGALLRRGAATINASWPPAATVLAGDLIFASAAKLAADTQSVDVMRMFAQTLETIVSGEVNHLFRNGSGADRKTYYNWIYAKTASMFELAAGAAAMLGNAIESQIDAAIDFGRTLGMAFQIVDDVLDFTGEQERLGKPVASDLRQGIITLPTIYYAETYPTDADIQAMINHKGSNEDRINRLSKSIRQSNAIQQAICEAEDFIQQAVEFLAEFPPSPQRDELAKIARYVIHRKK